MYSPREDSYVFQRLLTPAGIVPRRLQQVQLTEAILELRARRHGRVGDGAVGRAAVPGSPDTHWCAPDAARLLQGLDGRRAAHAGGDGVRG